jgi:hypothetical protein
MKKNFHGLNDPFKEAETFLKNEQSRRRRVWWNKIAHGIVLVSGAEQDLGYRIDQFFEVKDTADLMEVFANYEDDE